VAARLDRHGFLLEHPPPRLWAVLDRRAAPTYRYSSSHAGTAKTTVEIAANSRIVGTGLAGTTLAHTPDLDGPVTILSFDEGPDVVYIEGLGSGQLIRQPGRGQALLSGFTTWYEPQRYRRRHRTAMTLRC